MTISEAEKYISRSLQSIYDKSEASNISNLLLEEITGLNHVKRVVLKDELLLESQILNLNSYLKELLTLKPIQYVLGYAWFMDMKLIVDKNVLIPRPETEELVLWITSENKNQPLKVLDVGTGSGCIAIGLKKLNPSFEVWAVDVSFKALTIARKNAETQYLDINFIEHDFLDETTWKELPKFDLIVSNPPYIPESAAGDVAENVINFEPHQALFVPDEDQLLYYRKLALFSELYLNKEGKIYVEIYENLGQKTKTLFEEAGLKNVIIKKDFQEKDRMVRATK